MLRRPFGQPATEGVAGGQHVRFGDGAGCVRVAARHGVEQRGVLLLAALLRLGKELEVIAGHDADGLAQVGEEAGERAARFKARWKRRLAATTSSEPSMASASSASSASSAGVMRVVAISAALPTRAARTAKLSTASCGGDADHRHAAARGDLDQALVGQLEQGLSDRGAADPELGRQLVEVQAVARLEPAGEDPVAQFVGRLGPDGGRNEFDI